MLQGRNFIVYRDHKTLVYAFEKKIESFTSRQTRYLDPILNRHFSGEENVFADALSRISEISLSNMMVSNKREKEQVEDQKWQTGKKQQEKDYYFDKFLFQIATPKYIVMFLSFVPKRYRKHVYTNFLI